MYEKHFFRTRTRKAILHVRKTHLAYGSVSVGLPLFRLPYSGILAQLAHKTYLAYIHSNHNSACTRNTPGLHTLEPQFCMYKKHARPTCTRTPIAHVRKTRPAYIHSNPNCPCAKNTPGLHTLEPQLPMCKKHVRPTYTIAYFCRGYRCFGIYQDTDMVPP